MGLLVGQRQRFGAMNAAQLLEYQRDAIRNVGQTDNPTSTYYRPKEILSRPLTNWLIMLPDR